LLRKTLAPIEMPAFRELLRMRKAGAIMLFTSHLAEE
jgi:hypothetical protein